MVVGQVMDLGGLLQAAAFTNAASSLEDEPSLCLPSVTAQVVAVLFEERIALLVLQSGVSLANFVKLRLPDVFVAFTNGGVDGGQVFIPGRPLSGTPDDVSAVETLLADLHAAIGRWETSPFAVRML